MAESPSKRRRLSPLIDNVNDGNVEGASTNLPNEPTTPTRRASYLSPTKASLARSHPDLLAKSPKRGSLTEPRGRLLRQELLGSRQSTIGQASTPNTAPRLSQGAPNEPVKKAVQDKSNRDGFADAIAQSFQSAPLEEASGKEQSATTTRSPLRHRQPRSRIIGKRNHDGKVLSAEMDSLPVPTLIKRPSNLVQQPSQAGHEPELPPTPVQLGIGTLPDRPRGLHTSSSIGSKSGSGRHRRRVRAGDRTTATSSPLKPRNNRPVSSLDFSDIDEIENHSTREAPESDVDEPNGPDRGGSTNNDINQEPDELPTDFHDRQLELISMQSELEKLREDLDGLEALANQLQQESHLTIDEATINLLGLKVQNPEGTLQISRPQPLFVKGSPDYLKLCAPDSIQLKHETTTRQINKRTKVVHIVRLTAPEPWVPNSFHLSLNIRIDAKNACIDQIIAAKPNNEWQHNHLRKWVESRLQSPLHQFDVSGIVWGTGQYFEACFKKAKIFKYLDKVYNQGVNVGTYSEVDQSPTYDDATDASRYVPETQLLILPQGAKDIAQIRPSGGSPHSRQILVTYEIKFTWTGDVRTHVSINLTGANAKSQDHAKEMFRKLLPSVGVVKAFASVWDVLKFDQPQHETNMAASKQNGKLRKL